MNPSCRVVFRKDYTVKVRSLAGAGPECVSCRSLLVEKVRGSQYSHLVNPENLINPVKLTFRRKASNRINKIFRINKKLGLARRRVILSTFPP